MENAQESLQFGMPGCISETPGRFCDGFRYSVGPIITFHGQITARDRLGNQVHPMIQILFPKMTMPPFTQLELFKHGLKSMKVNFNIFPGQHNHLNITELLWSVLETEGRTGSHKSLPHL
jgi:hypothetical protein